MDVSFRCETSVRIQITILRLVKRSSTQCCNKSYLSTFAAYFLLLSVDDENEENIEHIDIKYITLAI